MRAVFEKHSVAPPLVDMRSDVRKESDVFVNVAWLLSDDDDKPTGDLPGLSI